MTPRVNNFARCGCGRSLDKPYCDGSHGLTLEQYEARKLTLLEELGCGDIACPTPAQCLEAVGCKNKGKTV